MQKHSNNRKSIMLTGAVHERVNAIAQKMTKELDRAVSHSEVVKLLLDSFKRAGV